MSIEFNPGGVDGGGRGFNPPSTGPKGGGSVAGSPGLLTSTGGLAGTSVLLMAPAFNPITNRAMVINFDSNNFDCEEDAEYDFRQEADYGQIPAEGRTGSFHLVILKYRELGLAKFSVNITVFDRTTDSFVTVSMPVAIAPKTRARRGNFPDNKIHTLYLTPPKGVIQGERPQVTITSKGNAGPYSVTRLTLCGNADEVVQK